MSQTTLIQTDRFSLTEHERSAIEHEKHHYEDSRAQGMRLLALGEIRLK